MKAQRVFRANGKTPAERAREKALRAQIQREKPSLEDLVRDGACDPDGVMTMGMYFDIQGALQALKVERERRGLSISDVAERSGLDRAVVSRLENGKQDNPTVATLMRYAAALNKRFRWAFEEAPTKNPNGTASARTPGTKGQDERRQSEAPHVDDILREVHRIREEYAKQFGYDLQAIHQDVKRQEQAGRRPVVSLPPRRPKVAKAKKSHRKPT
jgi:transcriptional regulator with XRE-family HTH domain